jgi:4-hydroxy-L-threonine phosphate dehydrogenase PdxA
VSTSKIKIALPIGDPAGIGPEICLKAALDPQVRAACRPILIGDADIIERHATSCGLPAKLRALARIGDADWSDDRVNVFNCAQPNNNDIPLGAVSAAAGRASIAFCAAAIKAAQAGEVDAVVAAPQNETSIAQAGIAFDGHPSFVARQTGTAENAVYPLHLAHQRARRYRQRHAR